MRFYVDLKLCLSPFPPILEKSGVVEAVVVIDGFIQLVIVLKNEVIC